MATRSLWKGSVGFGMVNIPVKLYGAVQEQKVSFNQLHGACGSRISMPKHCPECDVDVEQADLIKGFPVAENQYVQLTEQDMASLPVQSLKNVEVLRFIDASEIDLRLYDSPYFVVPEKGGAKAFALLLSGMKEVGKVAVGRLTLREREHMCVFRAFGNVMLLQTLHWAEELRDAAEVQVELPAVSDAEAAMAVSLIQALEAPANLEEFQDDYREAVLGLIEAKLHGEEITFEPVEVEAPTEDVMAALMASIEAVQAKSTAA